MTRGLGLALIVLLTGWDPARPQGPSPRPQPPRAPSTAAAPAPRSLKTSRSYVRDDAQVLTAAATEAINKRVAGLGGKAEIFILTRLLEDMALFEQASRQLFKEIVAECDHYRVIVVFIAYNRDRDRGTIGTNLGHGMWHIVSKSQCEELFGREDAPLTTESIQSGVEKLAAIIEQYERSQPGSTAAPTFTGLDTLARRAPMVLLILAGAGLAFYFLRREAQCPSCGAPLKTRVSISLTKGRAGRLAKKTFKCFRCGYARRQSLIPGRPGEEVPRSRRPAMSEPDPDELSDEEGSSDVRG